MEILPPLQATLNLIAFMTHLIDLKQFNTILVFHDQTTRNENNLLIDTLSMRYDVTWLLVNENNPQFWKRIINIQNQNRLVLTAVQSSNIKLLFHQLYRSVILNSGSKNIIVSNDNSESMATILPNYMGKNNIVLVNCSSDKTVILAWNPYDANKLVKLNETDFLRASNPAYSATGKYSGVFFDQFQNMRGKSTNVLSTFDTKYVYKIVSKDTVAGVDGTEIRLIDLIGESIQSPMRISVLRYKSPMKNIKLDPKLFENFLDRTFKINTPIQQRKIPISYPQES